ncbi:maltase A1-like [Anoplophora glabripennis]|uniref:maltase A1-like n=1 Tax=Anoplophora glabripennis TaxID=217634 RepID=UPI000C764B16|nr:maltase A1-like [Anoplophora glabripennis]
MKSYIFIIFAFILAVTSISAVKNGAKCILRDEDSPNTNWWKTAAFYQIYPRPFMDSDGDGIGDLQGIIQKLPHLQDAGVTATWLSPIFKSPQVDQGYDISDYRDIDPDYGTLDDLKELLKMAKEFGIRIILDFVPNHTSDQHGWFQKSVAKEEGYEDFYVWHDGKVVDGTRVPPNNWVSKFRESAWTFNKKRQQYYYHQYAIQQPDLNYSNPKVVEAMKDVMRYWLDFGVDGFRVDAVPYLSEDPEFKDEPLIDGCIVTSRRNCLNHVYTKDLPPTYDIIYEFRKVVDDFTETNKVDTRVMMTEAYTAIEKQKLYYGSADGTVKGAHFTFNFQFISSLSKGFTVDDIVNVTRKWLNNIPEQYTSNWVLGSHDNHRVATRLGRENVDGFNMLTAILPGVMVTYNGEEIGMENGEVTCEEGHDPRAIKDCSTFARNSRDFERTPFHWDGTIHAGFTTGTPWLPVSAKAKDTNLADQNVKGVSSHYNVYKQLMEFRKNFQKSFTLDTVSTIKLTDNVVQVERYVDKDEFILVFNVGDLEETVDFHRIKDSYKVLVTSVNSLYKPGGLIDELTLKAHESVILQGL